MVLKNIQKAEISYRHSEIKRIFKEYIQGDLLIDHFSVNIFFGGENFFLSPTPQMAEELCKKDFVNVDSNYKKEVYTNYKIYPWRSVASHHVDNVINIIKEEKFSMRNGMMIVRDLGDNRYVMYSFATHRKGNFAGQLYFLYHCKANFIAQMGDFMYNELLPIINSYTQQDNIVMPKIEKFESLLIENKLQNDWQKELFYSIKEQTNKDFLKTIKPIVNGNTKPWLWKS